MDLAEKIDFCKVIFLLAVYSLLLVLDISDIHPFKTIIGIYVCKITYLIYIIYQGVLKSMATALSTS